MNASHSKHGDKKMWFYYIGGKNIVVLRSYKLDAK